MKNSPKFAGKFYCEICDYECRKQSDFTKHKNTLKHQNRTKLNTLEQKIAENRQFVCKKCDKIYNARNSLWYHEKRCNIYSSCQPCDNTNSPQLPTQSQTMDNTPQVTPELLVMLIQQNKDMQNMMMEVIKNGINTTNNTNTTTTNSHNNNNNKTFNLQFFLNETCKDAMNIMDFVQGIVLNLSDLEETGRIGFAEGISKIINKHLKALDVTQRPIHCSDLKRETLYIKNENKWEKEEDDKPMLTNAVKKIAGKNMMQIFDWQKAHPDFKDSESRTSDKYMKMLTNVMSGGTAEETQENYEKIVKNIIKESTIDKDNFLI
jgi:hypothetical protein